MSSSETRTIESNTERFLDDILNGLLQKYNLYCDERVHINNDKIINSVYELTEEARLKSADVFKNMNNILNNNRTDEDRMQSFFSVIEGIFNEFITWGKIVVAFGFIIEVLLRMRNYPTIYGQYYDMSKIVLIKYMHPWVKVNGDWVYFENISVAKEYSERAETIVTLGKMALVTAGILALGKWLAS